MLALLFQAAVPSPPTDDVVVIGDRLKRWTGRISSNPLGTHCRTAVSTGDRGIGAVGCAALSECWTVYRPQIASVRDDKAADADSKRFRMAVVEKAFGGCLIERRDLMVADMVERRHAGTGAAQ